MKKEHLLFNVRENVTKDLYIDFCSIQAVLVHHAEEENDTNQRGVTSEDILELNHRLVPRECWDGGRRSSGADGVVDGSSPTA